MDVSSVVGHRLKRFSIRFKQMAETSHLFVIQLRPSGYEFRGCLKQSNDGCFRRLRYATSSFQYQILDFDARRPGSILKGLVGFTGWKTQRIKPEQVRCK